MPGKPWSFGDVLKAVRLDGIENVFNRWYSFYPGKIESDEDKTQQGKSRVNISLFGFSVPLPRFSYPVSPYAGRNHGFYFPQHEGETAWVTFEMGDSNSARVHGGWWGNDSAANPKSPSKSHVPAEFVKSDGSAPTARGIKTKGGQVLKFEDNTTNYHAELSSGENPVDVVALKDAQGNPTGDTITTVRVGESALKKHRVRLDDTREQIVIASFGEINPAAEPVLSADLDTEKDRKELEGRLRNWLLMRDRQTDKHIQLKTIGTSDTAFHEIKLSDTGKSISISTTDLYEGVFDDLNKKIALRTPDDYMLLLSQGERFVKLTTPEGEYALLLDKGQGRSSLSTTRQTVELDEAEGTTIQDLSSHGITINTDSNMDTTVGGDRESNISGDDTTTVNGDNTMTVLGDMTINVTGGLIKRVTGAVQMLFSSTLVIQATSVQVTASDIQLGTGNIQTLVNSLFLSHFDSHTHNFIGQGQVLAPTTPSLPIHRTVITRAG